MTTELLPSAVLIYIEANGKYLDVSEEGLRLLRYYLKFSSHQNNEQLCTFGQFSRLTNDEMAKDFKEQFVAPAVEKLGQNLVTKNGTENQNYWKIDLRVLVEKIEFAKQKAEESSKEPAVKQMRYMLDHPDWSLIYNPRVFDVEMYMKDKGSKHREEKEFFLTLDYEDVEAWADFFNGLVADLKKRNKLK